MTRVGMVGCGAVARIYYAPALAQLESAGRLVVAEVFDPDMLAASSFAKGFANARIASSFEDLLEGKLDLLIIASPASAHCEQSIAAARRGIAVHCEKPLATSLADGETMVAEAARAGRLLSVGMIRRRLAAARAIGALLGRQAIGKVNSIEIFEGGPFNWPVNSPAYFDKASRAVGVLEDIGSHVLDLLCLWFGPPDDLAYRDDAMGGVAANCEIHLHFGSMVANVRLSRDWHRPNRWLFTSDEGRLAWNLDDPGGLELAIEPAGIAARLALGELDSDGHSSSMGRPAVTFEEAFVEQLAALVDRSDDPFFVSGAEALQVLRIFEQCRKARMPMDMPWLA